MVTVLKACSTRAVQRHSWLMQQGHHSRQASSIAPSRLSQGRARFQVVPPTCALQLYTQEPRLLSGLLEPLLSPSSSWQQYTHV